MHKPAPLLIVLAILLLLSSAGSAVISDDGSGQSLQEICRAPSSWIYSVLDNTPVVRSVPDMIAGGEKIIEARVPRLASIMHKLPVGKGSAVEGWILGPSPRYL